MVRKSLELRAEEWEKLERLATMVGEKARATRGPCIGQASWRALVKALANCEDVQTIDGGKTAIVV